MISKQPAHHRLLLNALVNPASLVEYDAVKWELLLRLARKVKLLARLATDLKNRALLDQIPVRAANLLQSSLIQAERLQQITHWELNRVSWALKDTDIRWSCHCRAKRETAPRGRFFRLRQNETITND